MPALLAVGCEGVWGLTGLAGLLVVLQYGPSGAQHADLTLTLTLGPYPLALTLTLTLPLFLPLTRPQRPTDRGQLGRLRPDPTLGE